MGVSAVQMESSQRRDRLLLIIVLAQTLLHILGPAGEALGMSRLLKANTVKSRVRSLYRQGQTYLQLLPTMPEIQSEKLLRFPRITASATPKPQTSRFCSQCPVEKI